MKKLFSILAITALVFAGTSSSKAANIYQGIWRPDQRLKNWYGKGVEKKYVIMECF